MFKFIETDDVLTVKDFGMYLKSDLRFPTHYYKKGAALWRVFEDYRNHDDAKTIKGDASELLGLYSLMRHFIELRFKDRPDERVAERSSFLAACHIVDVILRMKTGALNPKSEAGRVELERAVFDHLRKHIAAYGTDEIKPKRL